MSPAVRRARLLVGVFCGLGLVAMLPWLGWKPIALFALVPVPLLVLDRLLARAERPERLVAASISLHSLLMLVGVAITGGTRSPLLPWVSIPLVTAAARFRLVVFLTGSLLGAVALVLACLIASPHQLAHNPAPLIAAAILLSSLVVVQQPLLSAEMRWRRDAVLDPLTGLLNRQGLQGRFREVAEQARLAERSLSLVVFDLDEFKQLNDQHGHAQGDVALKDVAYTLRKELRTFELLYRIGGEELLLILPGADLDLACEIAEHARRAIEQGQPAGHHLTASFGVSSASGDEIEFEPMFQEADRCLYKAKRSGRNCVAFMPVESEQPQVLRPSAETRSAAGLTASA
jgi:diguanylate cyclase (GGDEF)-like protein